MISSKIYGLCHQYNYDVDRYKKVKIDFQNFHNSIKDHKNELSCLYDQNAELHFENFILLIDELITPNENYNAEDIQKLQYAAKECIGKYFDTLKAKRKGESRRYSHLITVKYSRFTFPFSTKNIQNLSGYIGSIFGSAVLLLLAFSFSIFTSTKWHEVLSWLGFTPGLQLLIMISTLLIIFILIVLFTKHFVMRLLTARFAARRKNSIEESAFMQVAIVLTSAIISFFLFAAGQISAIFK